MSEGYYNKLSYSSRIAVLVLPNAQMAIPTSLVLSAMQHFYDCHDTAFPINHMHIG